MRSRTKQAVVVVAMALAVVSACGSDDDSSTTTSAAADGAGVSSEYATWCTSVQNLIEQSSPGDLSAVGDLAAFTEAIQSLATTAPEPINAQMQTLATASEAKLEAVQQDPTATLPSAMVDGASSANQDVSTWVAENCGGLQLPTIDL
jgi:hypothetical protein